MKSIISLVMAAMFLSSCVTRPAPPPTDTVQTEEQAIAIAKAHCPSNGQDGRWHAQWTAGKWEVKFSPPAGPEWPFDLSINSVDGKPGTCGYVEY